MKRMALCAASMLLLGCLAGCSTTPQNSQEQADNSSDTLYSNSSSTAQAYESDEVISSEEQAKAEEIRRTEIAEQYSIYESYGMTYNIEKDRFFYNGQIVRYFKDQVSTEQTNSFF